MPKSIPSSPILKRFSAPGLAIGLAIAVGVSPSATLAQVGATPEQQRIGLIQSLQKRMPGTSPNDWVLGASNPAIVVQAIPLNADNATNSADILAIGKKAWERKFRNGKSLANCFPNAGKRVASTYPQFDTKTKQVVTTEMAINRCLALHGEAEIEVANTALMGPLSAYFKSLSDGQKLTVRVGSVPAREKFDAGRALFQRRIGQQDFACASCHVHQAGNTLARQGLSAVVGQAVTWPRLQPGGLVLRLQMQFQRCMQRSGAEPFALGSEELNNLEYYHAFVSNGLITRALAVQR
jgi:sulfur-oxidizing protein SoxA